MRMRTLRVILFTGGGLGLLALLYHFGAESLATVLTHVTWWQFALICLVHSLNVVVDSYGWRYAIATDGAPFHRLVAARCAGDAVNAVTAVAAVGGEATKAWLLRRDLSYRESVPSLIVAKTAEVLSQALLLALGAVLAWRAPAVGPTLRGAMLYFFVVELIGAGGFLGVQVAGAVGKAGRMLAWVGGSGIRHAQQLDEALRSFYRNHWPRFLVSVALYLVGWLLGAVQGVLILQSLGLPGSLVTATIVEALWSAVRFTTFFVPASLGTLEGALAAAFGAFGFSAGAGLAFTLIRRASQAVWIGVGVIVLLAMRPEAPVLAEEEPVPAVSVAD